MKQFHNKQKKGVLLLETLLAVVILSTSLVFIVQSLTSSLRTVTLSLDYTRALFILENKMAALVLGTASESGNDTIEGAERTFTYTENKESQSGSGSVSKEKVDMEVSWHAGRKDNAVSLQTYILHFNE
jgi:Tfp pilus assembly protein PilV